MKTELGRKIGDRFLDRAAGSGLAVGILARKIISKRFVNFLQLAQEILVLRDFDQPRLARELKHAHRIVIGAVPKFGIEMTKETTGGRFPRPPNIETHLPQRFERLGKSRAYVVELVVRHDAARKYVSGIMNGNI